MPFDTPTSHNDNARSMQQTVCNSASEIMSRCANEIEVFGGGALSGIAQTGADRWKNDRGNLAVEGVVSAAAGAVFGLGRREYPALIGTTLAIGTLGGIFDSVRSGQISQQAQMLGTAWNTAWNAHDRQGIDEASALVNKAIGHHAFEAVYTLTAGAIGGGLVVRNVRASDELSLGRHGFTQNYYGKRTLRAPLGGFNHIGENGLDEYAGDLSHLQSNIGKLPFRTEPNVYVEKPRLPAPKPVGLSHYTGTFTHPGMTAFDEPR